MKNHFFVTSLIAMMLLLSYSCNKENEKASAIDFNKVTGIYTGTFDEVNGLKISNSATTEIRHIGGIQLEIHCYGELLDTTFIMDCYPHQDSIMLCATGNQFQHEYGHNKGEHHGNHHSNTDSDWMHHLGDDHDNNDKHYGGFDLIHHRFGYTFRIPQNGTHTYIKFEGTRSE